MARDGVPCVTPLREDAQAPESRPSSRPSSFRSVMGYRTHADLHYMSVNNHRPGGGGGGSGAESPHSAIYSAGVNGSAAGVRPSSGNYDHRYGYPV